MRGEMNSYQLKFHFCQNDRYEIHTRIEFQTHMRIRCNIQRVCAYSFRFGKIMFTWKSHAGLKFDFGQIDRYEISYRFEFILPLIWTYSKSMCFHFFFYCTSWHCLSESSLQLVFFSAFTSCNSENKITYSAQVRLHCVLLKKNNFW